MKVFGQQWRDALRDNLYPFLGQDPLAAGDGLVMSPNAIIDLNLMVADGATSVNLGQVVTDGGTSATLIFTDQGNVEVGRSVVTAASTSEIPIIFKGRGVGWMVIDPSTFDLVRGWPPGTHDLSRQILPSLLVLVPAVRRSAIVLRDGTRLTEDVFIVADIGCWAEKTVGGFKLSVVGDPFLGRTGPTRITKELNGLIAPNINFVTLPNVAGEPFRVRVEPGDNGVVAISLEGYTGE